MKDSLSNPVLFLGITLSLISCGENAKESKNRDSDRRKPAIAAVNYPLAYFAGRLSDDFATILFDVPSDQDPALWEPSDEQEFDRFGR